jgi:RNA polymerase sigma factor (sigma-70 family)
MSSSLPKTDRPGATRRRDARGSFRVAAESTDELTAAELAAAFRADEAVAATVLAERLAPLVARLVRRLSAWSGDCDDLVQDILVTALIKRQTFDGRSKLETWITRITINRCRAHYRKQWLRRKLFRTWAERQEPKQKSNVSGEEAAEESERAQLVRGAVAELPQQAREAVVLCYLEGLSVAEAAEALGIRRGTLEVRLTRARKLLRASLSNLIDPVLAES